MKEFYKYHGTGNDFIIIDNRDKGFDVKNIKLLCDRHFGIGADGLILLESSDKADCFMNYYNADATLAEMCGNGVRCVAKFFIEHIKSTEREIKELLIDTRNGIKKVRVNKNGSFSIDMGIPVFSHADFPEKSLKFENIEFNFVSMGNPHAVGMVKDISLINISEIGLKIELDSHFPNKINVELVEKVSDDYFKVKVWERGVGATLACGTGACAVYAILMRASASSAKQALAEQREITLEFPGGNLNLSENKEEIILRGEAVFVFKGKIE